MTTTAGIGSRGGAAADVDASEREGRLGGRMSLLGPGGNRKRMPPPGAGQPVLPARRIVGGVLRPPGSVPSAGEESSG